MCELFGFSASRPLDATTLPLAAFRARGGAIADNPDGWGVAWRENGTFQLKKSPEPGSRSDVFAELIDHLRCDLLLAHVRKARFPPVNTQRNTHPFLHACCGRMWAFAHNGLVPAAVALEVANVERICAPDGETDSEFAFCHLLSHVFRHPDVSSRTEDWLAALGDVSAMIAHHGQFNFLLSDGEYLIAYGHDRLHEREISDGVHPIVLVSTEPLDETPGWGAFTPGELRLYRDGRRRAQILTHPPAPGPSRPAPPL
ncbi:MAG: class II glutamine amidotransferase [Thiotrichales bacterium]